MRSSPDVVRRFLLKFLIEKNTRHCGVILRIRTVAQKTAAPLLETAVLK